MEELKLLVEMVAGLPSLALWVIAAFFAYKVVVIGSIYGVIRFVAGRMFDWLQARKVEVKEVEVRPMLDGLTIRAAIDPLMAQLHRLRGRGVGIKSEFIHDDSVAWLREAIDAKIAADQEAERKRAERKAA